MKVYVGSHEPYWLNKVNYPLCISRNRLWRRGREIPPSAAVPWILDSGAYRELRDNGEWTIPPYKYARIVERAINEVGKLDWAASMDWMCEPHIREKTGLTTEEHIERTIWNFLELHYIDDSLPIMPVLQGWEPDDYARCADLYEKEGIQLAKMQVVGIGGVCGLTDMTKVGRILKQLGDRGIRYHGFGMKSDGMRTYKDSLYSTDSMAWSFSARYDAPLPGCKHATCANCIRYATIWRNNQVTLLGAPAGA